MIKLWIMTLWLFSAAIFATEDLNLETMSLEEQGSLIEVLEQKLTQTLLLNTLKIDLEVLTQIQDQAQSCMDDSDYALKQLESAVGETPSAPAASSNTGATATSSHKVGSFFKEKESSLNDKKSRCKYVLLKAQDAISLYTHAINELAKAQLVSGGPSAWSSFSFAEIKKTNLIGKNLKILVDEFSDFALNVFERTTLSVMVSIAFVIGFFLRRLYKRKITQHFSAALLDDMRYAFYLLMAKRIVWFLPLIAIAFGIFFLSLVQQSWGLPPFIAMIAMSWMGVEFISAWMFSPPKPAKNFTGIDVHVSVSIYRRILLVASALCAVTFCLLVNQSMILPFSVLFLGQIGALCLISFCLMLLIVQVNHAFSLYRRFHFLRVLGLLVLTTILGGVVVTALLGYAHLSRYLLKGTLLTILVTLLSWLFLRVIHGLFPVLDEEMPNWQKKLQLQFGIAIHEAWYEFKLIRFAAILAVSAFYVVALVEIWSVSSENVNEELDYLSHLFALGDLLLNPMRIILAMMILSVVGIATRLLQGWFLKHHADLEIGVKEALHSMMGYLGIGLSIMMSLLVAGVNFSSLAIVAGALSVGIGFGLQNIFNNFISGLILLIERPIKPGDLVVVGNTEGIVKKISFRSTQIRTSLQSDVIVPNSELISSQVTNMMFRDNKIRVSIPVEVDFNSNIELVESVALSIANEHPMVSKAKAELPTFLFIGSQDDNLLFELACTVLDATVKAKVKSAINIAMLKAFRREGVMIANKQLDVYLKKG